ncbi:MAG: cell division protein FtsK [Actinomycetota bacterium]|nr:cell division protein FtsK [Actinomycetota bacterium]
MSATLDHGDPGAQVVPLLADPVTGPAGLDQATAPAYLDTTPVPQRRPIVPPALQRANIRSTARFHTGLAWHRSRYHGLRAPAYLILWLWHAARGAARLTGRVVSWWHWPAGWVLESQAVAAGRPGHHEAMRAHQQGLKTRAARGRIIAVTGAFMVTALAGLVMTAPRWIWIPVGLVLLGVLARHGRPEGRPVIRAAVVAPAYETPTPEVITRALGALSLAGINEAIRNGEGIRFITDVHRDGPGWGCDLDLPHGITAGMIVARRDQLASGLRRPLSATWPEPVPTEHEGRLRLWIGYQDLAKTRPPAWPLARSGQADVFGALPFGTDPRGRPVTVPVFEANWLVGAMPGQGKTSAVRVLACGAALDPLADLWVHEHAGKGDLEPLAQVCHRYTSGLDDDSIRYSADSLRMLRAELERRSGVLKAVPKEQRPDGKVTRELAARRSLRLRPVVAVFDEVQNLFMHPEHGQQAAGDAAYVIRLGRAYGIVLVLATQRPDATSLPTAISGNVSSRFCLRVPGQVENDIVLGTSSYRNGYKATAFRAKTDAGLGWLKADGDPQIVRTYYLDLPATEKIATRARAMRQTAGVLSGYALGQDDTEAPRSFAADVLAVFGTDARLWSATIAGRLAESLPGVYADLTPDAVASQLRALGVEVKNVREHGQAPRKGCERAAIEQVTS